VVQVASSSKIPLSLRDGNAINIYNANLDYKNRIPITYIDEDYFKLLEVEILQKSIPSGEGLATENGLYVNDVFIEQFKDQYALGDALDLYESKDINKVAFTSDITGVVKYFNNHLLGFRKGPSMFKVDDQALSYLLVRLEPITQHETMASIKSVFKENHPSLLFDFSFIEDEMDFAFNMFKPFTSLMYYFTFLAIFIASMGLFALALFMTQLRTKEISIRKVFGSSAMGISILLVRQYLKLIVISFLIAGPLTFFGFRQLLMMLPNKVELSWLLLAMVGGGLMFLAIVTVVGQAWKAAKSNPVDTLRYE
jgi:putative ABC transport system permease protein